MSGLTLEVQCLMAGPPIMTNPKRMWARTLQVHSITQQNRDLSFRRTEDFMLRITPPVPNALPIKRWLADTDRDARNP